MGIVGCHGGIKLAVKDITVGVELWGASIGAAESQFNRRHEPFDLVISLADGKFYSKKGEVEGKYIKSVGYKELIKVVDPPEILYLHWQDFGVPKLEVEFWNRLGKIIRKKGQDRVRRKDRGKGVYRVLVHCLGGHGRTGTCISILANKVVGGSEWSGDIVEKIRKEYCGHAVENRKQIEYVEEMTGTKSSEKTKGIGKVIGSFGSSSSSNSGSNSGSKGKSSQDLFHMSDEEWERWIKGGKISKEGKEKASYLLPNGKVCNEPRTLVDGILMTRAEEIAYRKRNK